MADSTQGLVDYFKRNMDDQEQKERETAARRYAEEDEDFYVGYVESCVQEDLDSTRDIRRVWKKCWDAYRNRIDYSDKQEWQSKVVTNDPFTACKRAGSIVRKAFDKPDYFTIEPEEGQQKDDFLEFIEDAIGIWFGLTRAKFPIVFNDATEMAFVTGQSKEIIPAWVDGKGLVFYSVEPWKIMRDPDADPRDPWSGMYWIHEDYVDIWQLKRNKAYVNLDKVVEVKSEEVPEKSVERKDQFFQRTKYRKGTLYRDFRGVILDKQGDLLLDNAWMEIAGGQIIRYPEVNPYVKMRWPGTSFSPFAHLTRFHGRGILEGNIQLWWMSCNLLSLFMDDLNWDVNKMRQVFPEFLADPADMEPVPGKLWEMAYGAPANARAVVEMETKSSAPRALPVLQTLDQKWQNGTMVTQFISATLGDTARRTLGENLMKRNENLNVFDSMGYDLELGAIYIILAAIETIVLNWTQYSNPSPFNVMKNERGFKFGRMNTQERRKLLRQTLNVNVSGISAQLKEAENLDRLMNYVSLLTKVPQMAKYDDWYKLNDELTHALGFRKATFLVDEEKAKDIDKTEGDMQQQMMKMQMALQQMDANHKELKETVNAEVKKRRQDLEEAKFVTNVTRGTNIT